MCLKIFLLGNLLKLHQGDGKNILLRMKLTRLEKNVMYINFKQIFAVTFLSG